MESDKELKIPGSDDVLRPGYQVKLGRFNTTVWTVGFGWYSASGNRPCCGWYLTTDNGKTTKPLQNTDLMDIYVIDIRYADGEFPHRSIEAIDKEVIDIRLGADGTEYETAGDSVRSQISELKKLIPPFTPIDSETVGKPGGVAPLDLSGKIDSMYIPDSAKNVVSVDDIIEAPEVGNLTSLYIETSTGKLYRWTGDRYETVYGSAGGPDITESALNGYIDVDGVPIRVYTSESIDEQISKIENQIAELSSKISGELTLQDVCTDEEANEMLEDVFTSSADGQSKTYVQMKK